MSRMLSEAEIVKRPKRGLSQNGSATLASLIYATAETGQALSFPLSRRNALTTYYALARLQGLKMHTHRDGDRVVVWCERPKEAS